MEGAPTSVAESRGVTSLGRWSTPGRRAMCQVLGASRAATREFGVGVWSLTTNFIKC